MGRRTPFVLQEYRTTSKKTIVQTPYSLVFGTEAMIPTEVVIPTTRYQLSDQVSNNKILARALNTNDELRDPASTYIAARHQRVNKAYNKNIKIRRF